jgi:hypothetical protein
MDVNVGRFARALLLTGGIATAIALPSLVGTPLLPTNDAPSARVALAAPAADNDGNDDPTNDNSDERNIEGSIIELRTDTSPPQALVGMVGGPVWARLYNNQLHNSGVGLGDYVHMQGEYAEHGIFDAYQVDVIDRGGSDNGNDND